MIISWFLRLRWVRCTLSFLKVCFLTPLAFWNALFFKPYYQNTKDTKRHLQYYYFKKKHDFFVYDKFYMYVDLVFLKCLAYGFNTNKKQSTNLRMQTRVKQVNWQFYTKLFQSDPKPSSSQEYFMHLWAGIRYIWVGLKYWVLGLGLGLLTFYYLMYVRLLPFNKVIFEYLLIIMFLYWLLSGFVFFIKKYQYSKFTSVIQRFWKRSYILFWVIESGIFLVFFYLTLNASEEPVYMYDQAKLFKTHLFSWRYFILKLIPVVTLIMLSYYLLLSLRWNVFSKQSPVLLAITLLLIYVFWLEFYQFFHIINFYGNWAWVYDYDEFLWNLDIEVRRTRLANNMIVICLLAKFWHLVFIFVFWVFFVLRVNEIGRVRYPLLAANSQNFIILYIMSWLYMYPWLKFNLKRHMEVPYYWFFLNARRLGVRVFFTDLKLFYIAVFNEMTFGRFEKWKIGPFFYWIESSSAVGFSQYKRFIIRDYIVKQLNVETAYRKSTVSESFFTFADKVVVIKYYI